MKYLIIALLLLTGSYARGEHHNIVLIVADDMSYGDLWRSPHPVQAKMTVLNTRFRNQGTLLQRYLTPAPVCSPSRYGLITGRNPITDGVRTSIDYTTGYNDKVGIPADCPTIYSVLKNAGYKTGHFGKWHLGLDHSFLSTAEYGIDAHEGWEFPTGIPGGFVGQRFLSVWGSGSTAERLAAYGKFDDLATDAAISFVQTATASGLPFFCNLSFHAPHYPLNPPASSLTAVDNLKDQYGRPSPPQIYYAAIHRLDYNVGRLFAALTSAGVLSNTIVVFTADNGGGIAHSAANSADQWGRGRNYRGQKGEVGNGGVVVPFGIRGPGIPSGIEHKIATVSGLDLAPSLCALVGVEWTGTGQGEDRSAVFQGSDVERTGNLFWLSIQGDAATTGKGDRFPAFRGYFPGKRVSVYLNLDTQGQAKDLAIYDAGLDANGKPIDPAEMQNLADPRMGLAGEYAFEIEELTAWAVERGAIPWIDPNSHGELSPDD